MLKHLNTLAFVGLTTLVVSITCRTSGHKPVVIQALYPQVVRETHPPLNHLAADGEGRSRQYYRFPETNNVQRSPERGQILHRPNKNRDRSQSEFQSSPNMPPMNDRMPMPMVINSHGKSKNVKYIPTGGFQSSQGNSNRAPPPQVYVISAGGDEDDQGMMGSVQTYFKSIPRRIKEAVQGFMGTVD